MIPGWRNYLTSLLSRLLPRATTARVTAAITPHALVLRVARFLLTGARAA